MYISTSTIAACLPLAPIVSAFYPLEQEWFSSSRARAEPRDLPSNEQDAQYGTVTLPLRRAPIRRENRYNISPANNPKKKNSVALVQDGSDNSYMVPVKFGTSEKEYYLLLDSAASNTWVMGQDCKSDACGSHNTYGPTDSKSLKASNTPFSVAYGTGTVRGDIATDTLHISSFSPTFSFGLATNVSHDFNNYPMDGIMGVGRGDKEAVTTDATGIMSILKAQGFIKQNLYGLHMSRSKDGLNDGEVNFGDVNTDRFDGEINYSPAKDNEIGYWAIDIEGAGVGGQKLNMKGKSVIIDSGTSWILIPPADANALHRLIPGSSSAGENFRIPCDTKEALQLIFNGITYNIPAADWIGPDMGSGNCRSNVLGRSTFGEDKWLVGDTFMKNVYTVFDYEKDRVGFGVKGMKEAGTQSVSSATATRSTSDDSTVTTSTYTGAISAGLGVLPTSAATSRKGTGTGTETRTAMASQAPAASGSTSASNVPASGAGQICAQSVALPGVFIGMVVLFSFV